MIHAVKCLPEYFKSVQTGEKRFEVREDDRPYLVGDYIGLNEWDSPAGYTGRWILVKITYALRNEEFCKQGTVIMSIEPCLLQSQSEQIFKTQDRLNGYGLPVYGMERSENDG